MTETAEINAQVLLIAGAGARAALAATLGGYARTERWRAAAPRQLQRMVRSR